MKVWFQILPRSPLEIVMLVGNFNFLVSLKTRFLGFISFRRTDVWKSGLVVEVLCGLAVPGLIRSLHVRRVYISQASMKCITILRCVV